MPTQHLLIGQKGEDLAARFLRSKGFLILERNWRYAKGELDLITKWEDFLVIVEVKTRSTGNHQNTVEAVNASKQELIKTTAEYYLQQKNWEHELRFDIVSIILHPSLDVEHFEWAF